MNTTDTHETGAIPGRKPATAASAGLGEIVVQRDALQAQARAEALLFTIRTVHRGIVAMRSNRTTH